VDRAIAYNIPGIKVDGKDVLAVYQAAEEAVQRARRGEGPTLIECVTYRNYGHFEGDAQSYKAEQEKAEHKQEKDAILLFRKHLLSEQLLDESEVEAIEKSAEEAVDQAVKFSEESPYPNASELLTDVYVSY
jgi:pyruvate dehydrogenase E1 component alpha subunit